MDLTPGNLPNPALATPIAGDDLDLKLDAAFKAAPVLRIDEETYDDAVKKHGVERMYDPTESVFGIYADLLLKRGWSFFPQERSVGATGGDARRPGTVDGVMLPWKAYQTRRPTPEEVVSWKAQCPFLNVAIVTGAASGWIFALDVDVSDPVKSWTVEQLAREILGVTPFRRVGRKPKFILLFRGPEDLRKSSLQIGDDAAIEVLAGGAPFTAFGKHHDTGSYFHWYNGVEPLSYAPEAAPFVTHDQLERFQRALEKQFGVVAPKAARYAPGEAIGVTTVVGGLVQPPAPTGTFSTDGRTVIPLPDLREGYVTKRSFAWATYNHGRPASELLEAFIAETRTRIILDGHWVHDLDKYCEERLKSACKTRDENPEKYKPRRVFGGEHEGDVVYAPQSAVAECADDEDIKLLSAPTAKRRPVKFVRTKPDIVEAARRALVKEHKDREANTAEVSGSVHDVCQRMLDDLWDAVEAKDDVTKWAVLHDIRLMIAPTGAGKTTTFVRLFAAQVKRRGRLGGPVGLMLPSYANIAEIKGRHEKEEAEHAKAEKEALDELTAAAVGLKTLVYMGKERGGCLMVDQMKALSAAGIGGAGLCEGKLKPGAEPGDEPEVCRYYAECPVMAMRRSIPDADLIFLPTAFLDCEVPKILKTHLKALVVDERCWTTLIHVKRMPLEALKYGRRAPYYTPKEKADAKKSGIPLADPDQYLHDREELNNLLLRWAKEGVPFAEGVLGYQRLGVGNRVITGESLLDSAIFVDTRTSIARLRVKPNLTMIDIRLITADDCDRYLWEEKRLYELIKQRVAWLKLDRNSPGPLKRACGRSDRRIAILRQTEEIRIRVSWRSEPNFAAIPMLMLDASADPDIIGKLWTGRGVKVTKIPAKLHLRVLAAIDGPYSNRSLLPSQHKIPEGILEATRRQIGVKAVLNACTALWGHSRVLVGSTQTIKNEFARAWGHLDNIDWLHFGATRGFDFAKHHGVAVSIGRLEMPPEAIDGMVAALTYDDQEPEEAIDALGTGKTADGKDIKAPTVAQKIAMRDGSDYIVAVPQWPGYWAAKVQGQFREEETRQFLGRLRPVYREGEAPLAIILSNIIPSEIVVDDVCSLWDLQERAEVWDAMRRAGGVLDIRLCQSAAPEYLDVGVQVRNVFEQIKVEGGFDTSRLARGLVRADYAIDGEDYCALGAACVPNLPWEIARAEAGLRRKYVDEITGITITEAGYDGPKLEMARARDEKLIAEVGTLEQRRCKEDNLRGLVVEKTVGDGSYNLEKRDITIKVGDLKGHRVAIPEAMILQRSGHLYALAT